MARRLPKVGGLAITTILWMGAGVATWLTISTLSPALRRAVRGNGAVAVADEDGGLFGLGFLGL